MPECREQQLPLPPIEAMRCRSEATKTKRCAVGKNEAMRCRFALSEAGFVNAKVHDWTGYRTSSCTQGALVSARKA